MNYLSSGAELNIYLEFLNKWAVSTSIEFTSQALDTRILRGGYAMLVPAVWSYNLYARTDYSENLFFDLSTNLSSSGSRGAQYFSIQPGVSYMPLNTLKFAMSVNYSKSLDNLQYIGTVPVNNETKYLLGKIDQHTVGVTFRIDYNITPELSIQYYGSPFASVGKFSEFKNVNNPSADELSNRYENLNPVLNGNTYYVSTAQGHAGYSFDNPDFNFFQFRSNLVLRWEYRPGSQLFLVWSQDRTNFIMPGNNSVYTALSSLKDVYPNNIFLIKFNYWFSI